MSELLETRAPFHPILLITFKIESKLANTKRNRNRHTHPTFFVDLCRIYVIPQIMICLKARVQLVVKWQGQLLAKDNMNQVLMPKSLSFYCFNLDKVC